MGFSPNFLKKLVKDSEFIILKPVSPTLLKKLKKFNFFSKNNF